MYTLICSQCSKQFYIEKIYRNGRTTCSKECRASLRKKTNIEKYGVENISQLKLVKDKKKESFLAHYGETHYFLTTEFSNNKKQKMLDIYGVDHPSRSVDLKEKKKNTMLSRYGVENPSQVKEFQDKKKETSYVNTGFPHASKSPEFQDKKKELYLIKHGVEHPQQKHISQDIYEKLNNIDWLIEQNNNKTSVEIADEIGVGYGLVLRHYRKHNIPYVRHSHSMFEKEIYNFISHNYLGTIERNTRSVIDKEIDIFLPDVMLGIECNGNYWHAELAGNKDRNYHLLKTNQCKANNISLIHIWEHEWNTKKEIVKSIILNRLNKTQSITGARQCEIKHLSTEKEFEFLDKNHIQGYISSKCCYGLFFNDELISLMSFGRNRFKKDSIELLRFCNKLNTSVPGSASKLFSYFVNNNIVDEIISYSHRDKFTGKLYKALGFNYLHSSPPSYHYTKNYEVMENRMKYQKHKLGKILPVFDKELTEWQNMQNGGYDRIWDCGNDVWGWKRNKFDK
jgi:hypothetical protein